MPFGSGARKPNKMVATSHKRGWPILVQDDQWIYEDDKTPIHEVPPRPCFRCGRMPTKEGHDACLGTLPGVTAACCGHGIEDGYSFDGKNRGIIPLKR